MRKKRGQISVEYILIFSLSIAILVPTIVVFRNFALSSGDDVVSQRLAEISNEIINTAREVHYYGPPSKKVIKVDMPPGVDRMGVIWYYGNDNSPETDDDEYFLAFNVSGSGRFYTMPFDSEIPLDMDNQDHLADSTTGQYPAGYNGMCDLHPLCNGGNMKCHCFTMREYSEGPKHFKIESAPVGSISTEGIPCNIYAGLPAGTLYCVTVDEVTTQLT